MIGRYMDVRIDTITVCTQVFVVLHMSEYASCIKNENQNNNITLCFHMGWYDIKT